MNKTFFFIDFSSGASALHFRVEGMLRWSFTGFASPESVQKDQQARNISTGAVAISSD